MSKFMSFVKKNLTTHIQNVQNVEVLTQYLPFLAQDIFYNPRRFEKIKVNERESAYLKCLHTTLLPLSEGFLV